MGIKTEQEKQPTPAPNRTSLSLAEENSFDRQIEDLEKQVSGAEIQQGLNHQAPNRANVQKRIEELRRIRETRSVRAAVGREREEVEMEIQSIKDELQKGMPTFKEYSFTRKKDGPFYNALKQWIVRSEQNPVRRQQIARWKYLKRRIDPTDPYIANTTNLFPDVSNFNKH